MSSTITVIGRSSSGLRNWRYDGHDIGGVVFYGAGQVYARVAQGWLEDASFGPDGQPYSFTHDVLGIQLDTPPVLARKENLGRTDNYVLAKKADAYFEKKSRYVLYIYLPEPPKPLGEFLTMNGDQDKGYTTYVEIPLLAVVQAYLPDPNREGEFKHTSADQEVVRIRTGYRSERTDFGALVLATEADFKAKGLSIPSYEVAKLLKAYDLTPKA